MPVFSPKIYLFVALCTSSKEFLQFPLNKGVYSDIRILYPRYENPKGDTSWQNH